MAETPPYVAALAPEAVPPGRAPCGNGPGGGGFPLAAGLPNGKVPVLEVDGFQLPQSMAILRYVGKLGGLYPTDDLEAAKCDAIIDSSVDFGINVLPSMYENDEAKKMETRADLAANFIPTWLANMEKQLASTEGIYFGEKMTVADIMIAFRIVHLKAGVLEGIPATIVDSYPSIIALHDSVMAEPKILAFVKKHHKVEPK